MRLVTHDTPNGPRIGAILARAIWDLNHVDPSIPATMIEFLEAGQPVIERAREIMGNTTGMPLSSIKLLAPVPRPRKVICVGLNYADHARETGKQPPPEPVIFSKFPTAVIAHGDPIVLPKASQEVDYEAELVAVVGQGGRHIPVKQALEHVFGYCCGHDVSARDWQIHKPGGQWLLGKTFDTFAPMGPELVTADEAGDPCNLSIQLRINDKVMQKSSTSQLIFSVAELVSYVSGVCTLEAGDVIYTGTPSGVGVARTPKVFLKPGDLVEVEIENLGVLRNPVVAE